MRISDWSSDVCSSDLPNLHDAWQDYPEDGRQSFHPVGGVMPESEVSGTFGGKRYSGKPSFQNRTIDIILSRRSGRFRTQSLRRRAVRMPIRNYLSPPLTISTAPICHQFVFKIGTT